MEDAKPTISFEEAREAEKKQYRGFLIRSALAFAVLGVSAGLCLSGTVNLAGRTTSLPHAGERLEFTLKYLTLPLFWNLIMVVVVVAGRHKNAAFNPLLGRDVYLKKQSNILQNSFEQFILSGFAQLIFVAFMEDDTWVLRTIPMVNFLCVLGRITFYAGYPEKRNFGFMVGITPTLALTLVSMYKFFEHLFF